MYGNHRRVVITGMSINVPIGDDLDTYYRNLVEGRSAITSWRFFEPGRCLSKVGGDLSGYDAKGKLGALKDRLPEDVHKRMRKLVKKAPFATRLSLLLAADAYIDARLDQGVDFGSTALVVGGHNLHNNYFYNNQLQYQEEPEYIDSMLALLGLDTDVAGSVGEALGCMGPTYTMGGACASANVALRAAVDEVQHHGHDVALVLGAPVDFAPMDLQGMAIMGAISYKSFNDDPERASRPYDTRREGFIPSHGGAVLVIEELAHARARGARIYAEVLGVATASDGCHLPSPSVEGQTRTMRKLLDMTGVSPDEVDYVNAHATSTQLGDLTEITSIKEIFGQHAYDLKVNATKSMLGHTCWSAPVVETVAAVLQMTHGRLHPTVNIDQLDPEIDLDVCANRAVDWEVGTLLKNSFGFGGINCCALIRKYKD